MKITAVGLQGNVQITDDYDSLSKNDDINIRIINNSTGKKMHIVKLILMVFLIYQ